jgi:hypothetical protein
MEASGVVVVFFLFLCVLAGHMVAQPGMVLMILCELVNESFITAVGTGNALGAYDEYVLHSKIS